MSTTIIQCEHCGFKDCEEIFAYGKSKEYGQHPEHRYCPRCGISIDWYGYEIVYMFNDGVNTKIIKVKK